MYQHRHRTRRLDDRPSPDLTCSAPVRGGGTLVAEGVVVSCAHGSLLQRTQRSSWAYRKTFKTATALPVVLSPRAALRQGGAPRSGFNRLIQKRPLPRWWEDNQVSLRPTHERKP